MRNAALILAVAAALLAGCGSSSTTEGSGHVVSVSRHASGFSAVEFNGAATIRVSIARKAGLTIRGDDNIVPLFRTKVENGVLVISNKHGYSTKNGLEIAITTPRLDAVTLNGAGTFAAAGIRATSFRLELNGTGTVNLGGTVGRLDASVAGVGTALLGDLAARDAKVTLAGAGSVHVNVAGLLDASVDGVGSILYTGQPRQVRSHVSGVGSIGAA